MNNCSSSVTALVLAGGKSSRMGQDKALISWEGIPMLTRVTQTAATCCQQVYIMTPWPSRYRAVVSECCQFLEESNPGQGPLAALAQGFTQISGKSSSDWILLLACDLPCLQTRLIQTWISHLNELAPETKALVPQQQGRWEPLCGFYRLGAQPNLQHFIQQGGRSFQVWLSQLPAKPLPVGITEAKMLFNCNTPEDLPPCKISTLD
ncbi:MAG: molybdenum cofactor guanylyltransferase [Symploca sp. SIO1C4]|uniref:Probable molybdenum cofactor guanylyltransferase n=1 Tax=Symploca sp. SIO1C4 TaxID=2607765 RepID=A0A6B3NIF1_9CYAN|nr:molybdenum cofactor guanylyltransferase [Symploca sp. SIO1C4]